MNHEPIESNLKHLSEKVVLRASEKEMHRENLMAFMKKNPAPVRSPYAWLLTPAVRYASALLLFFIIGTSGTLAAEGSRPGDILYPVKLKITEPARSVLTLDPEEKTAFELERTDRRLKEFAQYAQEENTNSETVALIASSLTESINEVTEDVDGYAAQGDADIALATNADLQSVLSAHSRVLDAIAVQNPSSSDEVDTVSVSIDAGIADTENAEGDIEDALLPSLDTAALEATAVDTENAYGAIRTSIENGTFALDAIDLTTVTDALREVASVLAEAHSAENAGDLDAAFLLYTEANQKLGELQTFIEADQDLNIGVLDASE